MEKNINAISFKIIFIATLIPHTHEHNVNTIQHNYFHRKPDILTYTVTLANRPFFKSLEGGKEGEKKGTRVKLSVVI